jgi:type I restriction enzyme S subunit
MAFTMTVAELIGADTSGMLGKHATWERVPLAEVATILNGAPFDSALFSTTEGMPLIRIRDVVDGTTDTYYMGPFEEAYLVLQGDLLVGMDGDFHSAFWGTTTALLNQRVCKISPNESFYDKRLLAFSLPGYLAAINANTPSVTVKHLSSKTIGEIGLPLPPRAEQTRIVAKLEELLSDLDAGVAELKVAQKKLTRYRQSLLKAAVEGALTAEWRAQHTPTETGTQLLQRILTERRARWEAKQLAKFKEQGKAPPKDWQKNYPEPVQPDTSGLPQLPIGWVWASVEQLTEFVTSGSRGWADYYAETGSTFIRSQNINKDWLDLSDIAFVNPPGGSEGARTRVQRDDVLLTITGANVGKAARVEIDLDEAYVSQHVALLRVVNPGLSWLLHLFLTAEAGGRGQLNKDAYGAGKPGLNLQQVAAVRMPLPGPSEIHALLSAVSVQQEAADANEAAITASLKQSTAQRQNILRAAFAGQLVPQDPNDEPASVLLERIRAERADRVVEKKPRGRKAQDAQA